MKKSVVIIIPGTKGLKKWSKPVRLVSRFFGKIFRIGFVSVDQPKYWKDKIRFKNSKVIWMHWARGVSEFSRWLAKKRLRRLIKHYEKYSVEIIGVSIAGDIILDTIKKGNFENVRKVILIGSVNPYQKINFETPPIINIYSKGDHFSNFAIKVLSPFNGGQKLYGKNVKNVVLPSLTHKDFCIDCVVKTGKFKGKSVTEIINSFL